MGGQWPPLPPLPAPLPKVKDGDGKEGRSAYNKAFLIDDIDLARYKRAEL